jgi:hypothetical protein
MKCHSIGKAYTRKAWWGSHPPNEKSVLEAGADRYWQSRDSGLVRAILAVSIMPTKRAPAPPSFYRKSTGAGRCCRRSMMMAGFQSLDAVDDADLAEVKRPSGCMASQALVSFGDVR